MTVRRLVAFALALAPGIARTAPPPPSSASESAALEYLRAHLAAARYMSSECGTQPITAWPNYEGRPVQRCSYSVTSNGKTLSAVVYLLNPSAENIALRIGRACAAVGLSDHRNCGSALAKYVIDQNGGQFPVAGFVIERKEDAGGTGPDPVYLEFRDGNTVDTADHLNFTTRQLSVDEMEHAARAPISATRNVARIANAVRADYRRAGGTEPVGTDWHSDTKNLWPTVIRANELRAQDKGEDMLLVGVAMGMRSRLAH